MVAKKQSGLLISNDRALCNGMVRNMLSKSDFILFPHIVPSRSSSKAIQTEGRMLSLDFPTPPPAITDANEYREHPPDEYLSLKVLCLLFPCTYFVHIFYH